MDYIGPLPADVQQMTVFSSGISCLMPKEAESCPNIGQIPDDARSRGGVPEARHGAGLKHAHFDCRRYKQSPGARRNDLILSLSKAKEWRAYNLGHSGSFTRSSMPGIADD